MPSPSLLLRNSEPAPLAEVPALPVDAFGAELSARVGSGARLAALFGRPVDSSGLELFAVLADAEAGQLALLRTAVGDSYPCFTRDCPPALEFERELAEQWGVRPAGHPWLKPIRFQSCYRARTNLFRLPEGSPPGVIDFFRVAGEEVHEVAVGPVHAGIIEPGHFRFQCHGEHVLHLEISLGYQHRGVERALLGGPTKRTIHYSETLAGDTTVGHATAYCEAVEGLSHCVVPLRAQVLRGIALELERLANHTGDLGALAGDIGYLPTAAYCGRIRGDFLNMTAQICGSRFGRGLIRPGGVAFDLDPPRATQLRDRLEHVMADATSATHLLWNTPSVEARLEGTGTLTADTCRALGLVGPPARACGAPCDTRQDFPSGIFRFAQIPVSTWPSGDVFARAYVRWLEMQRSAAFVRQQLAALPDGPIRADLGPIRPSHIVVSLVEGWRGAICHVAISGEDGRFAAYKVVDPSFHNWMGLVLALRDQEISDFPLCNKSFNLSYCGHDL
jgi:Ni,Fe-hydrogenase III large subunit